MTLSPSLAALHADALSRCQSPPSWESVVTDVRGIRLGAAQVNAAIVAGLAMDATLSAAADQWPTDVVAATQHLGLYEKYSPTTLAGVFSYLSTPGIKGLTSSVKGTVLELHVQSEMNSGSLPMVDGAERAELAPTLTQPGWDVSQVGNSGEQLAQIQVKATDSWEYIARHLSRYPEYPVATTSEAVQAAIAHGVDHNQLIDTGVSSYDLTEHVASALQNVTFAHTADEFVPEFAFAAIGVLAVMKLRQGADLHQTAAWAKDQATMAGLANAAGLAAQILTGTVYLRPLAVVGTRFTIERARIARQAGATLRHIASALAEIIQSCEAVGYPVNGRCRTISRSCEVP